MAVEIKSGNSTDLGTVDPTSKALRVTAYNSDGIEGTREVPVAITVAPVTAEDDDIISSIDVTEYKFISLQLTGTWVGTVSFQGSNDNGTFYNIVAQDVTDTSNPYSATVTANALLKIPVTYKYLRIRCTAFTSGTITGTAYAHKEDKSLASVGQIGEVTLAAETTKIIGSVNVANSSNSITGTITAADTSVVAPAMDGVLLTGTPSVNSYVGLASASSEATWSVEITGTIGGTTFYFEGSSSSTNATDGNWTSLHAYQSGKHGEVIIHSTTTAGDFTGNVAGFAYFRVRAVGGVGINANIVMRLAAGTNVVHIADSIPAGVNTIGSIDDLAKMGGAAVSMGAGAVDAGTQRVTLPSGNVNIVIKPGADLLTAFILGTTGTNAANIVNAPCILRSIVFTSYTATARHLKLYDTSGTPTAGSSGVVIQCSMAASGTLVYPLPVEGFTFSNGIGRTMVLGAEESSSSPATTQPDFSVSLIYQLT